MAKYLWGNGRLKYFAFSNHLQDQFMPIEMFTFSGSKRVINGHNDHLFESKRDGSPKSLCLNYGGLLVGWRQNSSRRSFCSLQIESRSCILIGEMVRTKTANRENWTAKISGVCFWGWRQAEERTIPSLKRAIYGTCATTNTPAGKT